MRLFNVLSVHSENPIADLCVRVSALSPELIPHNSIAQAAVDEALPYDLYCQWMSMRLSLSQIDQYSLSVSRRQAIAVFIDLVRRIEDCYVMKFHQNPSQITPEQVHVMQRMTIILMAIAEVLQHRASPGELVAVANVLRHLAPTEASSTLNKKITLLAKFLFFCSLIAWTVCACIPSMPKQREINFSFAIWIGFASILLLLNMCIEKMRHPLDRLVSGLMPQMQEQLQSLRPAV